MGELVVSFENCRRGASQALLGSGTTAEVDCIKPEDATNVKKRCIAAPPLRNEKEYMKVKA